MARAERQDAAAALRLRIAGMTCASCVGRVERAIRAVPGVTSAAVNLATETAEVHLGAQAMPGAVVAAIKGAGYEVVPEEITLQIEGMTCASCVGRVERALLAVPGVSDAAVNLATESALVRLVAGQADAAALIMAVAGAGYTARLAGDDSAAQRDASRDAEIALLRRDMVLAAALTLPVFVLAMGEHFVMPFRALIEASIGITASWIIQFVLTSLVMAVPGWRFFAKGVPALLKGAPDMNSLVALGTGAAWVFSVVATFAPGLLPSQARGVYFEAAAVIVTLILLGRWLEARAKGRTGAAIRHLVGLRPKTARVLRDGVAVEVAVDAIRVGDLLQVRPGERLAADGEITEGASYIDESMISGEPVPVAKAVGTEVIGGTINKTGAFTYRVSRIGRDTVLGQIIRMVEDAQGAKLPIQALVDRITAWFVPAVIAVAVLTVAVWLVFGPAPALSHALVAGVAVLIIACPCAMGLATPTSIMVGTGRGAEMGVLFRKGDALQSLHEARVVALDKTGTLTAGAPELTDLVLTDGFDEAVLLAQVAAVEARSEHPIAAAIVAEAHARGLALPEIAGFEAVPGYGVQAEVGGQQVAVGADRFMARLGIDIAALSPKAAALAAEARTPLYAAVNGIAAAVLAVADPIRPETPAAIAALHALGLRVVMITGDNARTAQAVARQLGIDEVVAEVLPEGKVAALEGLRRAGGKLAFVGDGINDAPALAAADIGIAIGTGTDVAIESADVVLMSGDLGGVVRALSLSRAVMANIRQNLFWAFGYNVLLIPLAAGALYPLNGMLLSPMIAAGAMAISSVTVLSNALRLRRFRAPGAHRPMATDLAPAAVA
ncbi:MAG: heavy metal translocating P-type ATPase [Pseudorhodobacter sp.]|nr:heavy metal translocating P-type ATPase [Pseudorhodobacter sp.]